MRGYIVAAREKTKAKISYIWDVTDQSGKRVHRITGEEVAAGAGKDPWAAVTPQVVQSIADKTATQIASWLPNAVGIPVATNTTPVVGASGTPGEKPGCNGCDQRGLPDSCEHADPTALGADNRQHCHLGTDYRAGADGDRGSGRRQQCVDDGDTA